MPSRVVLSFIMMWYHILSNAFSACNDLVIWFFLSFYLYYINRFLYVVSFLPLWDEADLIMEDLFIYVFLYFRSFQLVTNRQPPIHSLQKVMHIALGKVQGPLYYIYADILVSSLLGSIIYHRSQCLVFQRQECFHYMTQFYLLSFVYSLSFT